LGIGHAAHTAASPASPVIASSGPASDVAWDKLEPSSDDDEASSLAEGTSFTGVAASDPEGRAEASTPGPLASAGSLLVGVAGVLTHRMEGVANAATISRDAE
jgi:hypothetical protein